MLELCGNLHELCGNRRFKDFKDFADKKQITDFTDYTDFTDSLMDNLLTFQIDWVWLVACSVKLAAKS